MGSYDLSGVTGVTSDSREVQKGYLFAALEGVNLDGNAYVQTAIKAGASVILSNRNHDLPNGVRLIKSDAPRKALAQIAAQFYGGINAQPKVIAAVTGTNGKSSVVSFLEQIWQAQGHNAISLGTINARLTSLDPVALHKKLAEFKTQSITHIALEASSHGLDQRRLDGVNLSVAAFTNLSRDHLDYHNDMQSYLSAKTRLFTEVLSDKGAAVIQADSTEGLEICAHLAERPVTLVGRSAPESGIKIQSLTPDQNGTHVELSLYGHPYSALIPLVGAFQIDNLLCAAAMALESLKIDSARDIEKADLDKLVHILECIKPVKGRLQSVSGHPRNAQIFIDYAHTPDALGTVLKTVRPYVKGKLFCLFGCGGDRDKGKRPLMGKVAANHADSVIITDDNPRFEKSVDIRKQILEPIQSLMHNESVFEIGDRAAAIDFSIQQLQKGDALVIAGKGHESGQILADKVIPFDDYEQAQNAIRQLGSSGNVK